MGRAFGVRVQGRAFGARVQRVQKVQRRRFLGWMGPGPRVLKFDGAFGPEGCGGGFAASFIRPPSAASRSLSTHKRQVLRATFFSSMLPAHPPRSGANAARFACFSTGGSPVVKVLL